MFTSIGQYLTSETGVRLLIFGSSSIFVYMADRWLGPYLEEFYMRLRKKKGLDVLNINKQLTFGVSKKQCGCEGLFNLNCTNLDCNYGRVLHVLSFIENAQVSLDVCIYIITAKLFGDAIIKAHNRGLRVRVVADFDMSFSVKSYVNEFCLKEVPYRQRYSPFIMHHKFIIVDGEILINGSMNFTMTGIFGNVETVTLTSDPQLVKCFVDEFQDIWDDFRPGIEE